MAVKKKSFDFVNLNHKRIKVDEKEFVEFEGYLSTFGNIDNGDDVVVKGAFAKTLKNRDVKLLWQHDWSEPIGVFTEIKEDDKGLFVKGKLPLADDFVKGRVIPQLEIGSINSMSIGYAVNLAKYDYETDIRHLKEIELYEGSLVTIPMNDEAQIELSKSNETKNNLQKQLEIESFAGIEYKWNEKKAVERVEKLTETKNNVNVCDVIDNKLQIVPRAVFCLKAKIAGAKGGLDKEIDIDRVKSFVNKLYVKMDLEKPFTNDTDKKTSFSESELKNMPLSEVSFILRNENTKISKSYADKLASFVVSDESENNSDDSDKQVESDADFKRISKLLNF